MGILDETREFVAEHVSATDAQLDAMVLYAAATHGLRHCVTFGRMLFTSQAEQSGKTLAMTVTAHLSSRPMDTSGSIDAMNAAVAACSNEPEKPMITPYRDEISDVFGRSGLNGSNNPMAEYLRKGYKRGATRQRSVNRVPEEYSIFMPFLMTGLRTAVPRDIRSRCIVIDMKAGNPSKYYSVREGEPYARELGSALAKHVQVHAADVEQFRGRGIHPKLTNRKLEVWEPLLAVAYALGGQQWLNRAVTAFCELSLDESDEPALTPRQVIIKDVADIAAANGEALISAAAISDELRRIDSPLYAGRTEHGLICLVRDSLPCGSGRIRVGGEQVRAYRTADIAAAWEAEKPAELDNDVEIPEDVDDLSDLEDWDAEADASRIAGDENPCAVGDEADEADEADAHGESEQPSAPQRASILVEGQHAKPGDTEDEPHRSSDASRLQASASHAAR